MSPAQALRAAITANGGTPVPYNEMTLWRALVTTYGGTPTKYETNALIREAITAVGGTPTQRNRVYLLRELLTAMGVSPTSYALSGLYQQLSTATASHSATVLTWTSDTSTLNPAFTISPVALADSIFIEIATNVGFSTAYQSDTHVVTAPEAGSGSITFSGISALSYSTTYYARVTINGGTVSNTVTKTMAAAPPANTLDPGRKTTFIGLTNGNLTATASGGGGFVDSTISQAHTASKSFTVSVDAMASGSINLGLAPAGSTLAFGAANAVELNVFNGGWEIYQSGVVVQSDYAAATATLVTVTLSGGSLTFSYASIQRGTAVALAAGTYVVREGLTNGNASTVNLTGWA